MRHELPFLDFVLVLLAFGLAYVLRYDVQFIRAVGEFNSAPVEPYLPYALLYAVWIVLTPPVAPLYRVRRGRSWLEEAYAVVNGATNATVVVMALSFLLRPDVFSRLMIIEAAVLVVILALPCWRLRKREANSREFILLCRPGSGHHGSRHSHHGSAWTNPAGAGGVATDLWREDDMDETRRSRGGVGRRLDCGLALDGGDWFLAYRRTGWNGDRAENVARTRQHGPACAISGSARSAAMQKADSSSARTAGYSALIRGPGETLSPGAATFGCRVAIVWCNQRYRTNHAGAVQVYEVPVLRMTTNSTMSALAPTYAAMA